MREIEIYRKISNSRVHRLIQKKIKTEGRPCDWGIHRKCGRIPRYDFYKNYRRGENLKPHWHCNSCRLGLTVRYYSYWEHGWEFDIKDPGDKTIPTYQFLYDFPVYIPNPSFKQKNKT